METTALDVELSDELRAMRDAVRRFTERELPPWSEEIDRTGEIPAGLIELMQKNGYCGMRLPAGIRRRRVEPLSILHRARRIQPPSSRVHDCSELLERHDADGDHPQRHAGAKRKIPARLRRRQVEVGIRAD